MRPRFFPTAARWRAWLGAHHDTDRELWVGFYKKRSRKPSITRPEAVDQALCYGWIDGIRKSRAIPPLTRKKHRAAALHPAAVGERTPLVARTVGFSPLQPRNACDA